MVEEWPGYTEKQADDIAEALDSKNSELARTQIPGIADNVRIARRAIDRCEAFVLSEEERKTLDGLSKPISKIKMVLSRHKAKYDEFGDEIASDTINALDRLADWIGTGKQEAGRPGHSLEQWLVLELAEVWQKHHEKWPPLPWNRKGSYDGPFYRFVLKCIEPAGIELTGYIIKQILQHPDAKPLKMPESIEKQVVVRTFKRQ